MKHRFARQTLVAALTALAALGIMASSALATPKGEFAVFAGCPVSTPGLNGCIVAKTESGEIKIGKKTVPIKNTITLQGGFIENRRTHEQEFVNAAEGFETLSKTPQTVPGGLLGIVAPEGWPGWLKKLFNEFIEDNELTGVTATTELAGPVGLFEAALFEPAISEAFGIPALSLPVKVKLNNAFLGGACYIGSNSSPVVLNLITGKTNPPKPNEPITGKTGTISNAAEGAIVIVSENSLVNNSFAAPEASGCGGELSFLIDPAVDAELGLPSAEGHNAAILNGTLEQSGRAAVEESE